MKNTGKLPTEQEFIRSKCFHPTGKFVEFTTEEVEQSIPSRFEKIVRLHSDRLAVKEGDRWLTYDELNQTANRIARAILARCGDSDECVALLFEQSLDAIAAMLGALKAGKLDVVLDTSNPFARTTYMLEDSQAGLIVTNNQNLPLARKLAQDKLQLLNIDELDSGLRADNLNLPIRPDIAARIIYTSGSTGEPKGVVLNHRRILHEFMSNTNGCLLCAGDRVALLTGAGTAQGMVTTYAALLNGAAVCLFNVSKDGLANLANWLYSEQVTFYTSVPALFRRFASALVEGQEFPPLRVIKLGADQVRKNDVELYKKHFPNCLLKVFLSATETGNICQYSIDKETEIASDIVPVGYAVEGIEILLLDEHGKEVGNDQIGAIAVRSRYLALGYWRRPDLTESKFLPDPEGGDKRIYLTGDLGRRYSDGRLEYLGRMDSRVKIRGYTVEIVEIESVLGRHPAVREAVVLARQDGSGEKKLVAYVVARQTPTPTVSELRIYLKEKLPDYMIPSVFIFLESLPLSSNGKVDRDGLPQPDGTRPEVETIFVTPLTAVEKTLAEIWAEVLKLEKVGIHDNFFDLGGHSLAATRLISRVIQEFHFELPIKALFESPTVAAMSALIMQHQENQAGRDDLERILSEVEAISDEEAERVLKNRTGKVEQ